MRNAFTDVVGNRKLCSRLQSDISGGTLSHAYILEGARGTGKHMIALRIAAALSCEYRDDATSALPCMRCNACRKILNGNSPDVITVNRDDKATLGVEVIRGLRQDVWIAPNDGAAKIYLIEEAHLMTESAQNALLLTLEEPPSYVLFLLLCESTAPLLETIRSRAPTLRTEPIPAETLEAHLLRISPEASAMKQNADRELAEIVAASNGSIGRVLCLLDPEVRKPIVTRRATAREFIRLCLERHQASSTVVFLRPLLSAKRDDLIDTLNTLLLCLRDLLLIKQTENLPLCFFSDREEAATLAYEFTTPNLLALCEQVTAACDQLRRNANVRLTLTALAVNAGLL